MLLRKRGWKSVICVLLCIAMMLSSLRHCTGGK